ncbi:branched-chain amino acid ABC transporter permease [Simplicispira suum]|uniref:Branched-chain amino acid ABC transporter permease n=1 Tax=Simplicispira suum TaxID=2109915 RepID=A0A2S0N332_9BURK|nr:branched-chain amino acid ABC transporter permease [Simplicispira suum]AVO42558.1 branched-chain amino acid ABC transporter permease [Simplicispira suum]
MSATISTQGSLPAPLRTGAIWLVGLLALLLLPVVFPKTSVISTVCLMAIAIVFSLSYNMLLGQTGLLSFGHAVYFGLGGFFAAQVLTKVAGENLPVPLLLIPLVGGATGLFFGAILGAISTKRGGTVFAMITLGVAELVAAMAALMTGFFGGEQGVSVDRTKAMALFGLRFGSHAQVYYLILVWCLVCGLCMYYLTRTPFGRLCNAVRDNPMRVAFVGYSPQRIRFLAFTFSGGFAGIAGALSVINFEMAAGTMLDAHQSASVLLMTFIGGVGHFAGPILGAILVTWLQFSLSDLTPAWQLYLGLLFILVVMYLPGGIAQLLEMHLGVVRAGLVARLAVPYLKAVGPFVLISGSCCLAIELAYRLTVEKAKGTVLTIGPVSLNAASGWSWVVLAVLLAAGVAGWRYMRSDFLLAVDDVMNESRKRLMQ